MQPAAADSPAMQRRSMCSASAKPFGAVRRTVRGRSARAVVVMANSPRVNPAELVAVAQKAAQQGAEVVMSALDKPRNIMKKEGVVNDIVTETDKKSEEVVVAAIRAAYPQHAILGEEGGTIGGNPADSEYLWCVDPLDGTVNFAHGYQSFCVSVGVLRHSTPVAGCVIEFVGGAKSWTTRAFTGFRNGGAFVDGQQVFVSSVKKLDEALVATELVYYDEMWPMLAELHKDFTQKARGVRMSGAAAANMCHLAMGSIDAYFQYNLKPWDVAAGAVILEEAGGRMTTGDGLAYNVFDRSLIATNDALYGQVLKLTEPRTSAMLREGISLSPWCVPKGYRVRSGAQLS